VNDFSTGSLEENDEEYVKLAGYLRCIG